MPVHPVNNDFHQKFLKIRNSIVPLIEPNVHTVKSDGKIKFSATMSLAATATTPYVPSVEELHKLTCFVDNKDIAQVTAQDYFNENVIYFLEDDDRKDLIGVKEKPTLSNARLQIFSLEEDKQWYRDFIPFWIPGVLSMDRQIRESGKFKVNPKIIEADMSFHCTKPQYFRQTKLLYHLAYIEKVKHFDVYVKDSAKWGKQYKDYLTSSDFLQAFATMVKVLTAEGIQMIIKDITNKLDILDPSGQSALDVMTQFNHSAILDAIYTNLDDIRNNDIFRDAVAKVVSDILNSEGDSDAKAIAKILTDALQTGSEFINSLLAGFMAVGKDHLKWPNLVATDAWGKMKEFFSKEKLSEFFTGENSFVLLKKLISSIFYAAAVASFGMGIYSWNDMDNISKATFVFSSFSLVTTLIFHYADDAITGTFKPIVEGFLARNVAQENIEGVKGALKLLFTDKVSTFMENRVIPLFILASAGFIIRDIVNDANEGNIGAIVMDSLALVSTITQAILMFSSASWAGPLSGFFAILSIIFIIVKFKVYPGKTPVEKYFDKIPARYKLDTTNLAEPAALTTRANILVKSGAKSGQYLIQLSQKHVQPDPQAPSERNPFRIVRLGKSLVQIVAPFNYDQRPVPSARYFEEVASKLILGDSSSSTDITSFYLVATTTTGEYTLLSRPTGQFFSLDTIGMTLVKTQAESVSLEFKDLPNWFSSKDNTWSLPSTLKLHHGVPLINGTNAVCLIDTGLYTFDHSKYNKDTSGPYATYVKNNHTSQYVSCTVVPSYLMITTGDGLFQLYDKDDKVIATTPMSMTTSTAVGITSPFSMVFSSDANNRWLAIVDSNYVEKSFRSTA
ncbi:hypothetical protein DLAC_00221 [Tieghemostelium lacteum]|uniref:Uncharacterized protein n=1 Tax=Tieghemostelium lacteum TaxID=361077 RepID=A0A152A957_TIELA|nr:hypothetical protein DLAC_00221 [Tieghemostelium lacteum]|eukprot:KYR02758.1 hypothetical protein DLAC_00221 [Tieghemostelium lacteum]